MAKAKKTTKKAETVDTSSKIQTPTVPTETKVPSNEKVTIIGTGKGGLKEGQEYQAPEKAAAGLVEKGLAVYA